MIIDVSELTVWFPHGVPYWAKRMTIQKQKLLVIALQMFASPFIKCPWVDPCSRDVLNAFLFNGCVHSVNEITTIRALSDHPKDSTSTYFRDLIGVFLKGQGVFFTSNLPVPWSYDEFWHLAHLGPHRKGYIYTTLDAKWGSIKFDADIYDEVRSRHCGTRP